MSLDPLDPTLMDLAIDLARQSRPSPNPRVGAVIAKDGVVLGRGYHERQGMPHAEVVALANTGDAARGADLYVTLEPCCHRGHTGPCVQAIVKAGIARVAVGMVDPDPRVSGGGIQALEQNGVAVVVGLRGDECSRLLSGYTIHRVEGRPEITLKAAITLDGALAAITGDSKWISCKESRTLAHGMRADSDAVLVGIETVLKDDPELTVRHCPGKNPLRIVMDSRLRTPTDSKLIQSATIAPLLLVHTVANTAADQFNDMAGVETLLCEPTADGLVDPRDLAFKLGKRGILSLLVEGGAKIHGAFARAGIADRFSLFVAPKILGGGLPWISFPGTRSVTDGLSAFNLTVTSVSEDLLLEGRFAR
ncbi:MAG: bifunctional diaminohydroxyphosphoribosylaminopyrimidine deaminase/5-amino-6-(5-phosphoribosylamino)uracil reductase RibD [Deltaproteobacteria bacterium]|nr:bifunctional diaminohydroxyphosphoribosylaminopyrimidine deaminase/5-amino-6-(5-phosphoribosylamino)uracil reductase RibD [Deltaproteobacteria bacterium]